MRRLTNRFSMWVMPLRLLGSIVMLYGFIRIVTIPDAIGFAIGLLGALAWQAATAFEESSPLFRRLTAVTVRQAMATKPITVSSWWKVPDIRQRFGVLGNDSFFLVSQDGYLSGIAMPDDVYQVSSEDARSLSIGQLARPISHVNAVRTQDTLLDAFSRLESSRIEHVPVFDERGTLAGVITRRHIADCLQNGAEASSNTRVLDSAGERASLIAQQVAA
jgi:signal-transduction protein with cAMP-binding, CBS, and nucleotidyltransferase domain